MRVDTTLDAPGAAPAERHAPMTTSRQPRDEADAAPVEWISAVWGYRGHVLAVLDAVTVAGCFMLAYYIRFYAQFLAIKRVAVVGVGSYLKGAGLLAAVWVFFIWRDGGYETGLRGTGTLVPRIRSIVRSGVYALGVLMVISFMYRGLLLSRQVYLMTGVLTGGTMILVRLLLDAVTRDLGAQGVAVQRVVVVGTGERARDVVERLEADGGASRVVGFIRWDGEADGFPPRPARFAGRPVLGDLAAVRAVHARTPFDTLILSQPDGAHPLRAPGNGSVLDIVNFCEEAHISLYILPGAFDVAVSRREVGSFCEMPLIRLQDASLRPAYAIVKRLMDVVLAAIGLVLGMPIWLLIAIIVKVTSRGPVFFTQVRAGLHGRLFRMVKFRSMVSDAEARLGRLVDVNRLDVPGFKIQNDPRVTPFGRFLRQAGLDEIPQLLNVLKGEMSLVGPRPEMPSLVNRYSTEHRRRLKAKPGITGYQQVMARGIPLADGVKYDLIYLKHQGLLFDLYILLKTVAVIVRRRGVAY